MHPAIGRLPPLDAEVASVSGPAPVGPDPAVAAAIELTP
jgi:hypothetical protein